MDVDGKVTNTKCKGSGGSRLQRPVARVLGAVAMLGALSLLSMLYAEGTVPRAARADEAVAGALPPDAAARSDTGAARPGTAASEDPRALAGVESRFDPSAAELLSQARAALMTAPARTLSLLARADRRFGSDDAARRELEILALVRQGRIGLSHSKAEAFYQRFPDNPARHTIEQLTGYHPRPRGPQRPSRRADRVEPGSRYLRGEEEESGGL